MSIADKLTQLTNIRSNIRQKLSDKGVEASSHNFSDFATDIESIETGIIPTGTIEITENGTYDVTDKAEAVVEVASGTATGIIFSEVNEDGYPTKVKVITDSPLLLQTSLSPFRSHIFVYVTDLDLSETSGDYITDSFYTISNKPEGFPSHPMLQSINFPEGIKTIGTAALAQARSLSLTSLPESIETIKNGAFTNCALRLTKMPTALRILEINAFSGNSQLTSITFRSTLTSMASNVFYNCSRLTEIKVPWSEGEVANAPWGATNATITYNYTGE